MIDNRANTIFRKYQRHVSQFDIFETGRLLNGIRDVAAQSNRIARWIAVGVVIRHRRRVRNIADSEFTGLCNSLQRACEFLRVCLGGKYTGNEDKRSDSDHCVPPWLKWNAHRMLVWQCDAAK